MGHVLHLRYRCKPLYCFSLEEKHILIYCIGIPPTIFGATMFETIFSPSAALGVTESLIEKTFSLPVLSTKELSALLENKERLVLFDVRTQEEYAMSRIDGAIHLDPGTSANSFLEDYGGRIPGARLIFYCSVGQRSSEFLGRVHEACMQAGAKACSNLRGGIFRWYNEGRPVVNDEGETDDIHGYNAVWGMMIEKRARNNRA